MIKALLIGRSGDSYRVGYCKVYQARMWKRALDESEIKANMCKILNAEEHSDLMGYWVFSKGVGGTTVFENWGKWRQRIGCASLFAEYKRK